MPSPFPGMDPYLEDPALWPNVHQSLITYARDSLQRLLASRFFATIGERLYIERLEGPGRDIVPDVTLLERGRPRPSPAAATGGVALAVELEADAPDVVRVPVIEHREVFLEIVDRASGDRVVTVVEVLSPTNKRPGPGRDLYLQKQREVLDSTASLVEIDLLRSGEPTVMASGSLPPHDYRVVVNRPADRDRFELYGFSVRDRLPRVGIPLVPGVKDVVLDLPSVFAEVYEKGAFARRLDYALTRAS